MAILRVKEMRKMNNEELDKKMVDLEKELMKMQTQIAQGTPPESPGKVREIKRTISRILTIKKERGVSS